MKKLFVTIILCLGCMDLLKAQENYILDNTTWVHYYKTLSMLDWAKFQLGVRGDTIVNGISYHKLIDCGTNIGFPIEGQCFGGLRDDGEGKWYFTPFYTHPIYPGGLPHSPLYLLEGEPGTEFLIYDFSLNECDEFPFYWSTLTMYQINETEINGSMRKLLWIGSDCESNSYLTHWIEGIGCNYGLLKSIQTNPFPNGASYALFEVWHDGELLYKNPRFNDYNTSPIGSEWYYEILNEDSNITYQHLECTGDTIMQLGRRPKVIVRSNTQYDKDGHTEVTHEYIIEQDGVVFWWNRELQKFTTLYNLGAEVGAEWEIEVGIESITMHVDSVENIEYGGTTYRTLHVSDPDDLFSGDIVCGIGHLTSFFPEQLMNRGKDYRVEGLRCYWVDGELIFKNSDVDCDATYSDIHNVNENGPSTGSGTLIVYPNPTNNNLFVETVCTPSLPDPTYCISNLMGQTLLAGTLYVRLPQCDSPTAIDVSSLPAGMYFISVGNKTVKFVKQ